MLQVAETIIKAQIFKRRLKKMIFLNKASENLLAAQISLQNGLFNACANRAYYGALQAAIAALEHKGLKRKRVDHGWVQANFNNHFINRHKIYPRKFRYYLLDMQAIRDQADYESESITKKEAQRQVNKLKEFIAIIKREICK